MRAYLKWIVIGGVVALAIIGFGLLNEDTVGRIRYYFFAAKGKAEQITNSAPAIGNLEQARQCRENLHRIQAAKRKAAQDRGNALGAITWEEVLQAMYPNYVIRRMSPSQINALIPKCPSGGTYSVGTLEEVPRCSVAGNNTLSVEDDHIIRD